MAVWTWLVLVVAWWLLIAFTADAWPIGTIVAFAPRWPAAVPAALLLPAALVWRKLLWPLGAGVFVALGPSMGLCVPWRTVLDNEPSALRVMTCNTQGGSLDEQRLMRLIADEQPDLVLLQECSPTRMAMMKWPPEWTVCVSGALLVASRHPAQQEESLRDEFGWRNLLMHATVETPHGRLHVFDLHLDTPRWGLEEVRAHGWRGLRAVEENNASRLRESMKSSQQIAAMTEPVLIAGDFNMPVQSAIYQRYWSRYQNAFSRAGWGWGHSKFTRWHGIRIDHVLTSEPWRATRCRVGPDVGSDHRPVIADLVRT